MKEKEQQQEQRNVSYGQLAALEILFNEQVADAGVTFDSDEQRDEALFDFTQQYIDGNDNPQIRR